VAVENSPTEDIKATPKRRSTPSHSNLPPPIRWVQCPKGCGRWINPQNVEKHIKKCSGIRVASPQKVKTIPTSGPNAQQEEQQYVSCPLSAAKLRVGRMKRHMTKAHTSSLSNPLLADAVRGANLDHQAATSAPIYQNASRPSPQRTLCPVCKATVNVTRLKKHMTKVHKRGFPHSRPTQSPSAIDPTREGTTLAAPRDKNLDATKSYAHSYREEGRFGSHASHDGFDDESGPD
jgi:hypothetical protein